MKSDKKKAIAHKMHWKVESNDNYASMRELYNSMKKKKGKSSLNIPKGEKNEGNRMMEGRNENNRA